MNHLPDIYTYLEANIPLTPLKGKKPAIKKWTTTIFSQEKLESILSKANFGAVLQEHHLIIDVDPRNFTSEDTWERFLKLHSLDLTNAPAVKTGGGGFHYYFSKPPSINIVESLDGFEGIEFKSKNRQVVIPGSIHPNTKKPYKWIANRNNLHKLTEIPIPDNILLLIQRPHMGKNTENMMGIFTLEDIQRILDEMDPLQYRDHDNWLHLMMACHHASAGSARQEFINWSTQDPKYKNDDHIIGRRWDSLSYQHGKNHGNEITYRTLRRELYKTLRAKNQESRFDSIMGEVFPNHKDHPFSLSVELGLLTADATEPMGPFEYLNSKYCSVMMQNRVAVFHASAEDENQWIYTAKHSLQEQYEGVYVPGPKNDIPLIKAWYKWRYRRYADAAILDIEGHHKNNPRILNLWKGFAIRPNGDQSLSWDCLEMLILNGLVAENKDHYDYVIKWIAYMLQKPHIIPEVALVFTGQKGTGKSTLGRVLINLIGLQHAIHIGSPDALVGRFNAHLENKIFIFADEAISSKNKAQNSRLKTYITEPNIISETKGISARQVRNYFHIMMASNEHTPVDTSPEERRYAIFKVSDIYREDTDFFKKLYAQLDNGGYEKFMYDMLMYDLGDWEPRYYPKTEHLKDIKLESMESIDLWWKEVLNYEAPHPSNIDLNKAIFPRVMPSKYIISNTKLNWYNRNIWTYTDELKYLYCEHSGQNPYTMNNHVFWNRMKFLTGIKNLEYNRAPVKYADPERQMFINPIKEPHVREGSVRAKTVRIPNIQYCRQFMIRLYDSAFDFVPIEEIIDFNSILLEHEQYILRKEE